MAKAAKAKRQAPLREIDDRRYGDEVVRLKADGRFELTPHGLRMVEEVRMAEAAAATKKAPPQPPKQEINRRFYDAMREEIIKLEALAQKTLQAHPYCADADEDEEAKWRELAHARRQMGPLFDAFVKAIEPESETARYKQGFLLHLIRAMAAVAELAKYERLHRLHQREYGGRRKKRALDSLDFLIMEGLGMGRRAKDIWNWIVDEKIDEADNLDVEDGKIVVYDDDDDRGRAKRRLAYVGCVTVS